MPRRKKTPEEEAQAKKVEELKAAGKVGQPLSQEDREFIGRREQLMSRAQAAGQGIKQSAETAASIQRGEIQQKELNPQVTVGQAQAFKKSSEELAVRQSEEKARLQDAFLKPDEQADLITRTAQAGLIPVDIARNAAASLLEKVTGKKFGRVSAAEREKAAQTTAGKVIGTPIGFLFGTTIPILNVNLGNLSGLGNNISELEQDIGEITAGTRQVLIDARAGGSVIDDIETLQLAEENVRKALGDLNVAIQQSPKHIKEGRDASELAWKSLIAIQTKRHILERMQLTGNVAELDMAINNIQTEELSQ